jgi:hypothetical protein
MMSILTAKEILLPDRPALRQRNVIVDQARLKRFYPHPNKFPEKVISRSKE